MALIAAAIRLELHGSPHVVVEAARHALTARDAALLAWLAFEGPTARERILHLLWPRADRVQAQTHLRQNLLRLRKRCGRDLAVGDRILALAPEVELACAAHEDDAGDDDRLDGPDAALLAHVDTDEWVDFNDWLRARRARGAAQRRRRIELRIAGLQERGALDEALPLARRLVEHDPSDEAGHRRLIWLHFLLDDRIAARTAFDACCTALARTTGRQPAPQTRELLQAIERCEDTPPAAFAISPSVIRPPRLVGRAGAREAIDIAWQAGRPVLLVADGGLGKSRLLADLARRLDAGMPPVAARKGDDRVAYSLLARLLAALSQRFGAPSGWPRDTLTGLVAAWGEPPDRPVPTLRLRQAVDAVVDEWRRRGLRALVLDDLQYADDSSLDWLVHTAGRGAATRLPLLLAARAAEMPPALWQWCTGRGSDHLAVVELAPLDPGETAELLDSLGLPGLDGAAWSEAMQALTGGVPFDLLNILMTMQARGTRDFSEGPALLARAARPSEATLARLRQLPQAAAQLAQIAAVAGQDFEAELAAELLQVPSVAVAVPWRTLERAGVLNVAGAMHDLARRAIAESIPPPVASTLHRQVAEWLQRGPAAEALARAARTATHWEAAGRWADAGREYERAALAAHSRSARGEEVNALADAVRCHRAAAGPACHQRAFECEWQRVRLLPGLKPLDEALACADALLADATSDADRAAALEARAEIRWHRYEPEGALVDAEQAVALAGNDHLRLLASLQVARALKRLDRHEEALAIFDVPATSVERLDTAERLFWLIEMAGALDHADRRSEAIAAFDRAIAEGRANQLWGGVNDALNDKAVALLYANRLEESTEAVREALECGRRAGLEDDGLLMETQTLAANLRDLGCFNEALPLAEPLPARMRAAGYEAWASNAEHDLAGLFLWLGRPELAHRALTPLAANAPDVIRAARLFMEARLLRESTTAGAHARAADKVREAAGLLAGGASGRSYVRLKISLELARDEAPGAGAATAADLEAEATEREHGMLAAHARLLRVKLLRAAGQSAAAADAAHGLTALDHAGALYAPELWWTAWQALVPVDAATADRCLDRALEWIDRVAGLHVPDVFRRSFLTRNPVNAAVLAAAHRRHAQN